MSKNNQQRKPRAFAIPDDVKAKEKPDQQTKAASTQKKTATKKRKPRAVPPSPELNFAETDEAFFAAEERGELEENPQPPENRLKKGRFKLGAIAFAALAFLIAASFSLWIEGLVIELFNQNTWLGWAALTASIVLGITVLVFVVREVTSIFKLKNISGLRTALEESLKNNNAKEINQLTSKLESHFENQPMTAHGRATLAENKNEIIDAHDRYMLTERELLSGLDAEATKIVLNAAKRVSVVTAVSPRALVDIGYVLYENVRLIRVLSELYGGRAGLWGTITLARNVVAHLAITGTIAIGDGIIQQLLGHGLASKISARLGEGVVNGVMTSRIGLSAIDICRPAPFHALDRPKLGNFIAALANLNSEKTK